jgi:hypothetical protein
VFLRRIIRLTSLMAIVVAAGATYAFAASQALSATPSSSVTASSGLAVGEISYEPDRLHPTRVAAVRFRLASPVRGAVLATLDGGATWLACTARGAIARCPARGADLRVQDAAGLALGRA